MPWLDHKGYLDWWDLFLVPISIIITHIIYRVAMTIFTQIAPMLISLSSFPPIHLLILAHNFLFGILARSTMYFSLYTLKSTFDPREEAEDETIERHQTFRTIVGFYGLILPGLLFGYNISKWKNHLESKLEVTPDNYITLWVGHNNRCAPQYHKVRKITHIPFAGGRAKLKTPFDNTSWLYGRDHFYPQGFMKMLILMRMQKAAPNKLYLSAFFTQNWREDFVVTTRERLCLQSLNYKFKEVEDFNYLESMALINKYFFGGKW